MSPLPDHPPPATRERTVSDLQTALDAYRDTAPDAIDAAAERQAIAVDIVRLGAELMAYDIHLPDTEDSP